MPYIIAINITLIIILLLEISMQNENGSQTINFDTVLTTFYHQKMYFSQNFHDQPQNVVKKESFIQDQHVKTQESSHLPKRSKNVWTKEEECEYFYAAIKFSIENPYFTISWKYWKPLRFYNYLQEHMTSIFGPGKGRTIKQCKTKDQNLKIRYCKKKGDNGEQIDLIDISIIKLEAYIQEARTKREKDQYVEQQVQKINRYDQIIRSYKHFSEMKPKEYKFLLQQLRDHSLLIKQKIKKANLKQSL